jgi:hypothetical protein
VSPCEHHADHECRVRELEAEQIRASVVIENLRSLISELRAEVKALHEAVEALKGSNRWLIGTVTVLQVLLIAVVAASLRVR